MSSDAVPAPVTDAGVTQPVQEDPGFKVFAGNLAYATNDEGLKSFFETVSKDVKSAQVILRGTRSAGYGFVSFTSAEAAEKAVAALDKKELDGRQLIVEIAKPADQKDKEKSERRAKKRAGRRGGKAPPGEVTEAEANGEGDKATPADGEAKPKKKKNSRKPKAKKAAPAGETAADGAAAAPAAAATSAAGAEAAAKKKTPRQPRQPKKPRRPQGEAPEGENSDTTLFVANLGFAIKETELSELFTSAGIKVVSAHIVTKRWGQKNSKGFGFVDVGGPEEQQKAIKALDGKEVQGRSIAVKIAVNSKKEEPKDTKPEGSKEGAATPETAVVAH